jgi:hypothetical protein
MVTFGFKKAIKYIAEGEEVNMVSEDFKTHTFLKNKEISNENITHEIVGSNNKILRRTISVDDMKDKYGNNKFYLR